MTIEERIRTLCNVMREYHDCNFALHRAMNGEEFQNVTEIAHILDNDGVLHEVQSTIDNFILKEIQIVSPSLDNFTIHNFMRIPYDNFKKHAFNGEHEECIKNWDCIFEIILKMAKEDEIIHKEVVEWSIMEME